MRVGSHLTLIEAVNLYLDFLIGVRRASSHTVKAYHADLLQFDLWIQEQHGVTQLRQIKGSTVSAYVLYLQTQRYASATQARKIASIKSLFKFCRAMEYSVYDQSNHVARPRISSHLPKVASVKSIQALIEATSVTREPFRTRDRAMLETLYATGLRVSELLTLNIRDIDFHEQLLRCYGKGNRERLVPIHDQAALYLQDYIGSSRTALVHSDSQTAVFLNRFGKRLSRQGFWVIIKGYARKASVEQAISPHTFRHSFATHMIEGGAPISYVQAMLGHTSVSTTEVYNHIANDYLREEFESAHPRAILHKFS